MNILGARPDHFCDVISSLSLRVTAFWHFWSVSATSVAALAVSLICRCIGRRPGTTDTELPSDVPARTERPGSHASCALYDRSSGRTCRSKHDLYADEVPTRGCFQGLSRTFFSGLLPVAAPSKVQCHSCTLPHCRAACVVPFTRPRWGGHTKIFMWTVTWTAR
ncbi:hypothetical protein EXIGLDRAFT_311392 [Exidia glandulosa HHB12029]|uniref:Uncharacterized protein n=1 Tax=Exidia glandulosa HHB12029 TaxID=1314781 RepID=A0A165CZJ0_EXIGL|nr:hypothetical protein EXIGLDRAFT_311392 [Exidia glandulosa HHB12029]